MIKDAKTGRIIKRQPWQRNLVFDIGLNALAGKTGDFGIACSTASALKYCQVGSGTNANSVSSGAITLTQSTTTVTASSGIFTSGMVGAIIKLGSSGSAGQELYITSFTDSTHVTVNVSQTIAVGTQFTIWNVQQTVLQTALYSTNSYQTSGTSCGTTFAGAVVTHQVTYSFAQQASPYTVNEIGYGPIAGVGSKIVGRIVLGSSDSIGTTNIYIVQLQLQVTFAPNTPTAVGNVGTNINTAGNAVIEFWGLSWWQNNGTITAAPDSSFNSTQLDAVSSDNYVWVFTSTYSQNAATASTAFSIPANLQLGSGASWVYTGSANAPGTATLTYNYSLNTTGQSAYGVGLGRNSVVFDIKFTATQTLPNGIFAGTIIFALTYSRTLTN